MALTKISNTGLHDDAIRLDSIDDESIDEARLKISNSGSNGEFLSKQSGNTGGLTWSAVSQTDTTYTHTFVDSSNDAIIRLTAGGSGSGNDDLKFVAGSNITLTPSGDNLTIAATDTNTVYTHPNHSGEVTSSADGATVIVSNIVDEDNLKISNSGSDGQFLQKQSGAAGGLTWASAVSSLGGASGADYDDSVKVRFGTGNDLEIYHNGTHSIIENSTGDLQLLSDHIDFWSGDGSERIFESTKDGSVNLFYNGVKKLEPTADGAKISGTSDGVLNLDTSDSRGAFIRFGQGGSYHNMIGCADGLTSGDKEDLGIRAADNIFFSAGGSTERMRITSAGDVSIANDSGKFTAGASDDLKIYHNGSHNYIESVNGNTILYGGGTQLKAVIDAQVELYFDNSKKLQTYASGVEVLGNLWLQSGGAYHSDSVKGVYGTSDDLQIFHNGTRSKIQNNTGDLRICSNAIQIKNYDDDETYITCAEDGAVELYYDNTKKLNTHPNGLTVAGNINMDDNYKLLLGSSGSDLQIFHDGSHSYIKDAGTGELKVLTDFFIVQNAAGNETQLTCDENGAVSLYHDNSKKFETASTGVLMPVSGADAKTALQLNGTNGSSETAALIIENDGENGRADFKYNIGNGTPDLNMRFTANTTELYYDGSKKFETTSAGVTVTGGIIAGGLTYPTSDGSNGQVLTTNGSGTLSFSTVSGGGGGGGATGTDYNDNVKVRLGTGNDLQIYHDATDSYLRNETGELRVQADDFRIRNNANNQTLAYFEASQGVELFWDNSKKFETNAYGIKVHDSIIYNGTGTVDHKYDNQKTVHGTGDDLQIYHNGSNSYINNATGALAITGNDLNFENAARNETYAEMDNGGAVKLYYDNVKKIETSSSGVTLPDGLHLDNATNAGRDVQWQPASDRLAFFDNTKATFGDGVDLQIYHNGNHS